MPVTVIVPALAAIDPAGIGDALAVTIVVYLTLFTVSVPAHAVIAPRCLLS